MKKNQLHLVPNNIQDIVEQLQNPNIRSNERMNYVLRLEAIRDYCEASIKKSAEDERKKIPAWKITREYCG
jgi:hypothetical protein